MALLESYVAGPPPLDELENGAVRVRGTRVSLDTVISAYKSGATPEDIVRSYSTLNLRDVYAVITYYLDRQDTVEAYLARQEQKAKQLREEIEADQPSGAEIKARLLARKAEKGGS